MYAVLEAAQADRHVFIHFHNHNLDFLTNGGHVGGVGAEIKEAVLIHGSNLEYSYIERSGGLSVVSWKLRVTDRSIVGKALGNGLSLDSAHARSSM